MIRLEFPIVIALISLGIKIWSIGIKVILWKFFSNDSLYFLKDFRTDFWSSGRDWKGFLSEKKVIITRVIDVVVFIVGIIDMEWQSLGASSHCGFNAAPLGLFVLVAWIHYTVNSLVWEEKMVISSEIQVQVSIRISGIFLSNTISGNSHWVTWISQNFIPFSSVFSWVEIFNIWDISWASSQW